MLETLENLSSRLRMPPLIPAEVDKIRVYMLGAVLGAGGPAENPIHTVLAFRDQYPSSMKWDNPKRAFLKN